MNTITGINSTQFKSLKMSTGRRTYIQHQVTSILHQDYNDIAKITNSVSPKKVHFIRNLAEWYNEHNFYRDINEVEDSTYVTKVFESIKNPKKIHLYIGEHFADSFKNMARIIDGAQGSSKKLQLVKKINDELFQNAREHKDNNMIIDIIESPHAKEYANNYKKIKPYLILNKNNPNAIKDLDKMFETKTFDAKLYKLRLDNKNIKESLGYKDTPILNKEVFFNNYNKYTSDFIKALHHNVYISTEMMQGGVDKDVLYMLTTLNKNNHKVRNNLLSSLFGTFDAETKAERIAKIKALKNVFEIIDNDKYAKDFVKKSMTEISENIDAESLQEILTNISTKKLSIFRKNAWNIIEQTKKQERIETLKREILNPLFITQINKIRLADRVYCGFEKDRTFFSNAYARIANFFNILRDKMTKDVAESIPGTQQKATTPIKETIAKEPKAEKIEEIEKKLTTPINEPKIEKNVEQEILPAILPQKENAPKEITKTVKQIIAENVLSFISPKLGEKTCAKQNDLYSKNATKIRLGMLPEIFSSVADTRKADRAVGKKRINSANKDVLNLYLKINGKNKKFVNYLLKKRNVDNTRMFEVKDIIAILDKAEAKIAKDKKLNPAYKAKDARQYYNHLYEAKIEQYGKVKPQRKLKTNA